MILTRTINPVTALAHSYLLSASLRPYSVMSKPRDIQEFLAAYPGTPSNPNLSVNLGFYSNALPCRPDNLLYEDFVKAHSRDYHELELNHGYIQWLFPIREHGVNPQAQPLQMHEIEEMQKDPEILKRLVKSYKMMLGFYGIDFNSGHLKLADDHVERLANLRSRSHNLLRITRMMKHLSEFSQLQRHVAPFVLFFVALHSEGLLDFSPGTMRGDSMDKWWSNCFRHEDEMREIRGIVGKRGQFGERKWGFSQLSDWYSLRAQNGEVGYIGK